MITCAVDGRPASAYSGRPRTGTAGLRILGLDGAVPIEGGLPLVVDGKIVGAIGLSGGSAPQDGQCATAGVDALM